MDQCGPAATAEQRLAIFDFQAVNRRVASSNLAREPVSNGCEHDAAPECDKKCDKNPAVAAKIDAIGSSAGKGINKFRVFNIARRIRLTGSPMSLKPQDRLGRSPDWQRKTLYR